MMDKTTRWHQFKTLIEEFYYVRFRQHVKKEIQAEEDLLMLLCFSEALGIPNVVSYYTLELTPLLVEDFHEWHQRMGYERSPIDGIRCC